MVNGFSDHFNAMEQLKDQDLQLLIKTEKHHIRIFTIVGAWIKRTVKDNLISFMEKFDFEPK